MRSQWNEKREWAERERRNTMNQRRIKKLEIRREKIKIRSTWTTKGRRVN